RGHCAAVHALRDGPHGVEPRSAPSERGFEAYQRAAALDPRHLRISRRRFFDHDGYARRPNRPPSIAAYRRRRLRGRVGYRGVFEERRNADRGPCSAWRRRRDDRALYPLVDPEHVPRSTPAHLRDRRLGNQLLDWWRSRSAAWRRASGVFL